MIRQQEEGSAGFDRVKLIRDMRYRSEEESQLSISNIFKNYPYIHSLIRKYKDQTGRKVKNRFIFDVDMTRSRVDNLPHIHKS